MSIDDLPDDALFEIFRNLDSLEDLFMCYNVSKRWRSMVAYRMNYVKYLIDESLNRDRDPDEEDPPEDWEKVAYLDTVCLHHARTLSAHKFVSLLVNLNFLAIGDIKYEFIDLLHVISLYSQQIKGLSYISRHHESALIARCPNLEMLASNGIEQLLVYPDRAANIKQLSLRDYDLVRFIRYSHFFPNLKRLHCENFDLSEADSFRQIILPNLEILELKSCPNRRRHPPNLELGLYFIDECPALKSLYISCNYLPPVINYSLRNFNLENLVLSFRGGTDIVNHWNSLRLLLWKFPSIRHLAVRNILDFKLEYIEEMIRILPHLVLLDMRTREPSVLPEDIKTLTDKLTECGRNVYIYHYFNGKIESDWPQLENRHFEKICFGFDFMKHCFLRGVHSLPYLMDPEGNHPITA